MSDDGSPRTEEEGPTPAPANPKKWYERLRGYSTIFEKAADWWKAVVVGALIPIFGFLYSRCGSTKTTFSVVDADPNAIRINVSSTGPESKWSTLRDYQLKFGDVPIEDLRLRVSRGKDDTFKGFIPPGRPVTIYLTADGLRTKCRQSPGIDLPDRYTKQEIESFMEKENITMTITVQESNEPDIGRLTELSRPFPAKRIKPFLLHYIPDHLPLKTSCY